MATGMPNLLPQGRLWCEICKKPGHDPYHCMMMQKYQTIPKNSYCTFCKSVGHDDKDCRTMELMRERTSDAYKVQAEMIIGQAAPQFNLAPAHTTLHNSSIILHNNPTIMCSPSTTRHSPSTILRSIISHHNTTRQEVIAQATKEQDEPEEVSNAVEDQSHVTIANNQDIMHVNVHGRQ
jgi:hypothetical protein